MSELKYWIWFSSLAGVRPRTKKLLLDNYQSPRQIYYARADEYLLPGMEKGEAAALSVKNADDAVGIIDRCADDNITIVTMQDAVYPQRLRNIYDPPAVLYVRGRLPAMDEEAAVAIVGTRSATPYGEKMAGRMGYEITKCGGLVVSGLTRGVDAQGARGALMAGGPVVGVLGTAIDGELRSLERDTAAAGALVSEYPPGAAVYGSNFRARNRITSGLSVAVVVVEAPARSGALLFADEAAAQGREVYAVPSNADSPTGEGSNGLIKDGAIPAEHGWDIMESFQGRFPHRVVHWTGRDIQPPPDVDAKPPRRAASSTKQAAPGSDFAMLRVPVAKKDVDKQNELSYIDLKSQLAALSEEQLQIISVMTEPSMHVDDIIEKAAMTAPKVLAELTMLQISGVVTQGVGKRFTLNIKQK